LKFLVVDELHAYLTSERGRQLQSLMHRLEVITRKPARRIALSATLGDLDLAAEFLRPGSDREAVKIRADDESELRMALLGFADESSDHCTGSAELESGAQALATADEIPKVVFNAFRGKNNLLFANTRLGVELYTDKLRRLCEEASVPNEFFAHHGSLSKPLRRHAEEMLRNPNRPATAVCTSTLELGIDIGHIESVGQIDCPPSVSSIRQRLGRSGRRGDPAVLRLYVTEYVPRPDSSIEERLHLRLTQTIAQVDLLLAGWCEFPIAQSLHLSTLLHQILSMIGERGGVTAAESWRVLCQTGPFANVGKDLFVSLLRQMAARNLIEQAPNGTLLLGPEGERVVSQRGFYAIFHTPEEYTLMAPDGPLGSLPISHPLIPGNHMIFGGQRWLIRDVDSRRRVVTLVPSPAGKPPRFEGSGWLVGREVRRKMRNVLAGHEARAYLDKTAEYFLQAARRTFADLGLEDTSLIQYGGDSYLFCWTSDLVRHTLRAMLASVSCEVDLLAVALRCPGMPPSSFVNKLREALRSDHDPVALASQVRNRETEKYDEYLGDNLTAIEYASRMICIQETRKYIEEIISGFPPS
jgi:ATP-dependent Lhr-like helicase